ncbi:H-NS histone family protein [Salmonella enterica subsp. enterica serovar Hvittingfoss]|nr:H-NS histone family protein [Salmonella enterica subsp. enterica serovar Hvittingfoss]
MYRDPDNPFNTWTGIGKRPTWLQKKLQAGYVLEEMKVAASSRDTKTTKYRDPDNPDNVWSGTGRRPDWLKALLDKGMTLNDLKV